MKQIFAIFLAICVLPGFHSYAWVGGPFSNNTYFGEQGDDGIYEAVAIPRGGNNGIGLFRWAVTNAFQGLDPSNTTSINFSFGNSSSDFTVPVSGNVSFDGVATYTNTWFIEGNYYRGFTTGTVNSGLGIVSATGVARTAAGINGVAESISSGFTATFTNSDNGIPVRRFEGRGRAAGTSPDVGTFTIAVFGTKVQDTVFYFGL